MSRFKNKNIIFSTLQQYVFLCASTCVRNNNWGAHQLITHYKNLFVDILNTDSCQTIFSVVGLQRRAPRATNLRGAGLEKADVDYWDRINPTSTSDS